MTNMKARCPQEMFVPSVTSGASRTIGTGPVVHRADDLVGEVHRVKSLCPICGMADQVRKVSSIVGDGTVTTETRGNSLGVAVVPDIIPVVMSNDSVSTSRSRLASWMAFPELRVPRTMGLGIGLMIFAALSHLLGAAFAAAAGGEDGGVSWPLPVLGALCLTGPFWLIGAVLTLIGQRDRTRYRAAEPTRQRMWELWNASYYCFRDDVAYLPGGPWFHPSQMHQYLDDASSG